MVDGSTELHRSLAGALRFAVLLPALALGSVQAHAAEASDRVLRWAADGVQIYACAADQDRFTWRLQRPEAVLVGENGERRGQHGAGPSWQAEDGSTVVGTVVSSAPSPTWGSIPWLMLRASSHDGNGVMGGVAYILRTDTVGGAAPPTGCDAAHAGAGLRVPYRATYLFLLEPGLRGADQVARAGME